MQMRVTYDARGVAPGYARQQKPAHFSWSTLQSPVIGSVSSFSEKERRILYANRKDFVFSLRFARYYHDINSYIDQSSWSVCR